MRDNLDRFIRAAGAWVPDATAMAILLIVGLGLAALAAGNSLLDTSDAFYRGLWMLLAFTMQMVLMLVLASIVGGSLLFRRAVGRLAGLPRSIAQVFAGAVLLGAALSYLHWALSIALSPLVAVTFARAAEERGLRVDFPCLLATVYASGSIWQYGFSSTPALLVATPGHFLEAQTGVMPLASTIWSPAALAFVVAFPLLLILVARLVMPREVAPLSSFPDAQRLAQPPDALPHDGVQGAVNWSERSRVLPLLLAAVLLGWLLHHFVVKRASLDLNSVVAILLFCAVVMQPHIAALSAALRASIGVTWQVVVLYQLYGGVAGLLQYTSLGADIAQFFASFATPLTFPLLTAIAGTVIAVLVPSSGGQWIIQGFITSETAAAVGVAPQLGLLALGIGDQMGNLLSPFWMVLVAGIARVSFRSIYGYGLLFAALWFSLGVAAFTLLPVT